VSLRGDPRHLRELAKKLRTIPKVVAQDVARAVAPELTVLAAGAYTTGRTVYGDARPAGSSGNALDLVETGATLSTVRFVANGTIVRCVLGTRYARFLVGRYRILPMGNLPVAWSARIGETARRVVGESLGRAA
jgi:hypothetical protein